MDVNYFGLLRLAQEFAPALKARAADGPANAIAWVNVLSIFALTNYPRARHLFGLEGGALVAVAGLARGAAAGRRAGHQSVSGSDRRRMGSARDAAEAFAGRARRRDRRGAARARSRTSIPATWRRTGSRATSITRKRSSANCGGAADESAQRKRLRKKVAHKKDARRTERADRAAVCARTSAHRRLGRRRPSRRSDANTVAGFPADRAAAGDGPEPAVPHRGNLALRRARAGLVLEQCSVSASIPARISTRRFTGFPAATCRTIRSTRCRSSISSRRLA